MLSEQKKQKKKYKQKKETGKKKLQGAIKAKAIRKNKGKLTNLGVQQQKGSLKKPKRRPTKNVNNKTFKSGEEMSYRKKLKIG